MKLFSQPADPYIKAPDYLAIACLFMTVSLLLLINTSLNTPLRASVSLFAPVTATELKAVSLEIRADNRIMANGVELDQKQVELIVKAAAQGKKPIMIRADKKAKLEKVVMLWELIRTAGATDAGIAVY